MQGSIHALQEQLARAQGDATARCAQQEAQLQASYKLEIKRLQDRHVSKQAYWQL